MKSNFNKAREEMCFKYLNELRESGLVNMFCAVSYLEAEFELERKEAKEIFIKWTNTFNKQNE